MSSRAIAGYVAVVVAGGCIGFEPINQRPSAQITDPEAGNSRSAGDTIALDGIKSRDPDGDALEFAWAARSCIEPGGVFCDATIVEQTSSSPLFAFRIGDKRTIRVELEVTDGRGAGAATHLVIGVANREPTVSIQVQPAGDITVGRPVTFIATGADPDETDELSYVWSLDPPAGSVPQNVEWSEVDDRTRTLRGDIAGLWRVRAVVDDGDGGSDEAEATALVVEDQPPCIRATDPVAVAGSRYIVDRGEGPRLLRVASVADDLDSYPPPVEADDPALGQTSLRWLLATPDTGGAFVEVAGHAVAEYLVDPAAYAPGHVLDVRVEARDRVERALPCDDSQPTCSTDGTDCVQRVTWGVEIR